MAKTASGEIIAEFQPTAPPSRDASVESGPAADATHPVVASTVRCEAKVAAHALAHVSTIAGCAVSASALRNVQNGRPSMAHGSAK